MWRNGRVVSKFRLKKGRVSPEIENGGSVLTIDDFDPFRVVTGEEGSTNQSTGRWTVTIRIIFFLSTGRLFCGTLDRDFFVFSRSAVVQVYKEEEKKCRKKNKKEEAIIQSENDSRTGAIIIQYSSERRRRAKGKKPSAGAMRFRSFVLFYDRI